MPRRLDRPRLPTKHLDVDLPARAYTVLPEWSHHPPALTSWGDELALASTGSDRRINVSWTQHGVFSAPVTLQETSMHGPALAAVGDELALAWTGTDRRLNLLITHDRRPGPRMVRAATSSGDPGWWAETPGDCGRDVRPVVGAGPAEHQLTVEGTESRAPWARLVEHCRLNIGRLDRPPLAQIIAADDTQSPPEIGAYCGGQL